MTRPTRPEVSDPTLRAALDRAGTHIESYNTTLDLISKDIRAIEQYLSDSGMRLVASANIGYSQDFTEGDYDVLGNYSGGIQRDVERIEWAPAGDERWRLMYVMFRRFGEIEICERIAIAGPTFMGNTEELERKPLIETPVSTRLRAHKHLAKLVEEVGKLVEYSPITDPESTKADDIPF